MEREGGGRRRETGKGRREEKGREGEREGENMNELAKRL